VTSGRNGHLQRMRIQRVRSLARRGVTGARPVGDLVLRRATYADLPETARIHVGLLPAGLFPALGERFVRQWHRTYLDSPFGVALVACDAADPAGGLAAILLGSTDHAGYMNSLLKNRRAVVRLAVAGAGGLLRRPRLTGRFLRTRARRWLPRVLLGRDPSWSQRSRGSGGPVALLDAVAVRPQLRGRGVATDLVNRFLVEAGLRGARLAELVTYTGSDGAAGFYDLLGWTPVGDYVNWDGSTVRIYRHSVTSPERERRVSG
jgi:GNAT superfamily N-acetyltransferase